MSQMSTKGYCGAPYDRYAAHNEQSTVHKLKETYWTTKQAVYKKLGKKQDEHVVASDAELDSKLEVFRAIQKSSIELLRAIEMYQDRLCALSQEENAMGRFLKSQSQVDKTRAGKMMAAVGKAQSFSSQQRLALRVPLVRLYQEVETFRYRAISDTLITINRMESARTEYRGALMWMKDISEELDPDTYKQLEKFRKVQAQVKKTKAKFDKLKLDSMQKIDLLAASRCNMYSHVLANYQSTLLHFWSKTSRTMSAVAESFKGYQYYEFNMLKELSETSKKLADETGGQEGGDGASQDGCEKCSQRSAKNAQSQESTCKHETSNLKPSSSPSDESRLIELDEEQQQSGSMTNLLQAVDKEIHKAKSPQGQHGEPFIDFDEDDNETTIEEIKQKQDAEFDIPAQLFRAAEEKKKFEKTQGAKDLLSDDLEDDLAGDDMALLNDILNAPPAEDDFANEWQSVFGASAPAGTATTPADSSDALQDFMPSNLLDMGRQMSGMSMAPQPGMAAAGMPTAMQAGMQQQQGNTKPAGQKKADMSAWFNLFADLDPLADPDAVGRQPNDKTDSRL